MIDFEKLKNVEGIEPTKNNLFTLKIDKSYIHSQYDPYKEAARIIKPIEGLDPEKTLVIFFGAGLGYHIELAEKKNFKNIIIIERNEKIYNIFSKTYNLPEEYYIVSPFDSPEKLDSIFSLIEIQKFKNVKTIILRSCYAKELYSSFEERLEKLLKVKLGDFSTRLKFEELWFINILRNIRFLNKCVPVEKIFKYFSKLPVILISAGPSLKESLPYLKKLQDYAILIAVDTALLPLFEAEIKVDFVYSLDSQIYNINDLNNIDSNYLRDINFIFDIVSSPGLTSYFCEMPGRSAQNFVATTAHLEFDYNNNPFLIKSGFVNWIEAKCGIRFGDIETGGSVSTSAFHLGYMLGGNPLILVGQDLSFPYFVSHSPSTSHFYKFLLKTSRLNSLETLSLQMINSRKLVETSDNFGKILFSDFVFQNFKGWFEESAKNIKNFRKDMILINSTLWGIPINNFTHIPLDKLISIMVNNNPLKPIKKNFQQFSLIDSAKVDKIIQEVKKLKGIIETLPLSEELFECLEKSDYYFLKSIFMQEKVIFERYNKFEQSSIQRKIERLIKNIEGLYG